jgi:hypothetical protein
MDEISVEFATGEAVAARVIASEPAGRPFQVVVRLR